MISVYKSFPDSGSKNVGDRLIGESAVKILRKETSHKVRGYYDIDTLLGELEEVNRSKVLFVPAFGIRSYIWRKKLADAIKTERIRVPVVPLAAGWSDFPGDYNQITSDGYPDYDRRVISFYKNVAKISPYVSTRDYYTWKVLDRIDVDSEMIGDCAWYDPDLIGKGMYRPDEIKSFVITDPHGSKYIDQLETLMRCMKRRFPSATGYFCLHSSIGSAKKRREMANMANNIGYDCRDVSGDTSNLELYSRCDLHVGYRVHGHVSFLRRRRPSILLCEDGRGLGFTETIGGYGFPAFTRGELINYQEVFTAARTFARSVYYNIMNRIDFEREHRFSRAKPAGDYVIERIIDFVSHEIKNNWSRYNKVPSIIDSMYKNRMLPFIKTTLEKV